MIKEKIYNFIMGGGIAHRIRKQINREEIITFFSLLVIRLIFFFSYEDACLTPDSPDYFRYDFSAFIHQDFLTASRTPVYPIIVRILTGGDSGSLYRVVIFQSIISFCSLFFFYGLTKLLVKKKNIALSITFLYGASSMVFLFDNAILTESLALSGAISFFYYVVKYLKDDKFKDYVISEIILLILIFLRPSFLLFNMILLGFLLVKFILRKKPFKELLVCTSTWIVILLYSVAFYSSTGIFSLSDPMPRQLMLVTIERGYYKDYKDENFVEVVDECLSDNSEESKKRAVWSAYWAVKSEYDLPEIQSIAKECIKKNADKYLVDEAKCCASVIRHSFLDNSYVNYKEKAMTIVDIFNRMFNNLEPIHVLLLGMVSVPLALVQLLKHKTLDWMMAGFAVFICGIFFSTMIATNDEFIRTMIHIVPLGYLAVAYFIGKYVYHNKDYIEKI